MSSKKHHGISSRRKPNTTSPVNGSKIQVNGRTMKNNADVKEELRRKRHDLICPITWLSTFMPFISNRGCVRNFEGLADGKYETIRSEELAHTMHLNNMKNGIIDLEPLRPAIVGAGNMMQLFGISFFLYVVLKYGR
jgi:hypothetical protein